MKNRLIFLFIFPLLLMSCSDSEKQMRYKILIFTATAEYVHNSTASAVISIITLCRNNGIAADTTSDGRYFTETFLNAYDAVMFLNTSGDVLDENQQQAFEKYIRSGKGFIGIHGATNTEYDWPWYGRLVGVYFKDHPKPQQAKVKVIDQNHISTRHLPAIWIRHDEWYNFRTPLSSDISVLIEVDENSYQGGSHGAHHPFSWYQGFEGGRSWYTAGGHFAEHYNDPRFAGHIIGGIQYAIGGPKQ